MASVRARLDELRAVTFPDVCAVAGAATTRRVPVRFAWVPTWWSNALRLPASLLVVANARDQHQLVLAVPLSEEASQRYARRRTIAAVLLAATLVGLVALPAVREGWLVGLVLVLGGAGVVARLFARWQLPRLHVTRDGDATLTGLHPAFVTALDIQSQPHTR